jgi:hypothetical protein
MLIWQDKKTGQWNWYGRMPTVSGAKGFTKMTICRDRYNQLCLYCVAEDGQAYCIWQDPHGNWFQSGRVMFASQQPSPLASAVASGNCADGGHIVIFIGQSDGRAYFMEKNTKGYFHGLLE